MMTSNPVASWGMFHGVTNKTWHLSYRKPFDQHVYRRPALCLERFGTIVILWNQSLEQSILGI